MSLDEKERDMIRRIVATLSLVAVTVALAACNTVEGMGKDVKATGQAIEKAADKNKTY
jgi:predicted small secreted protein